MPLAAMPTRKKATTAWVLILTNCIPLVGVLFFGWSVFETVFLYWMESALIALVTIALLVLMPISAADREGVPVNQKLIAIPFFVLHFGAFMWAHLFLIVLFLGQSGEGSMIQQAFETVWKTPSIGLALLSLVASHAYSFFTNYIVTKKYLQPLNKENFWSLMQKPYKRIFMMQLTVLLGAFAITLLRLPQLMVVALVAVKIFFDLKAHKKEDERGNDTVSPAHQ